MPDLTLRTEESKRPGDWGLGLSQIACPMQMHKHAAVTATPATWPLTTQARWQ